MTARLLTLAGLDWQHTRKARRLAQDVLDFTGGAA